MSKLSLNTSSKLRLNSFLCKKKVLLQNSVDLSRKGSIDEPIKDLIRYINNLDEFVTTSSCSGRIIVVSKNSEYSSKKSCKWVLCSHTTIDSSEFVNNIKNNTPQINMVLKFEPFILHLQCRDIYAAKKIQNCALAAGFRNSGSVFGRHGNITFAVRGTHGLEVPLSNDQGLLVVSDDYLQYIIEKANTKINENGSRIENFSKAVYSMRKSETEENIDVAYSS